MSKLHMQVAGTEQGIEGVRQATEVIEQAWRSGRAAVSAEEGQLGRGRMGEAFMSVYRPEAERVERQKQAVTSGGLELVAASRMSIAEYEQVDERARAEFERLLSPGLLLTWRR